MAIDAPLVGTKVESASSSTSTNCAYPAGMQAGDLMLLPCASGAAAGTVFDNTDDLVGDGWTELDQFANAGNTNPPEVALFSKFADGSESGNLAVPHTNVLTTQGIFAFRGVDPTTPFDFTLVRLDKTSGNNPNLPFTSPTVITPGTALFYVVVGNSTSLTCTPATGFTEDYDRTVTGARSWEVAHRLNMSPGVTGTISPTLSGNSARAVGILIGLRPAPAAGFEGWGIPL
jgi:hypothetical protein